MSALHPKRLLPAIHGSRSGRLTLAGAGQAQRSPAQNLSGKRDPNARRRVPRATLKEENPTRYVKLVDRMRHFHYTPLQCQPRSTSPALPPNPTKELVRASSAGSAAQCAASLSAASPSPVPCGAPRRHKIRNPPRPGGCASRAPLYQPRSFRRPCSRICSPPAVIATPRPPAATHFSTRATRPLPRRHIPNSAPKPVRFSTHRSRIAIPRPWSWYFPRSPSTSIRSSRPKRVSWILRYSFPTCGTA